MAPKGGGQPTGDVAKRIDSDLGGFDKFKEAFTQAALTRFGSGWAWLSVDKSGKLSVESSANQDSPLMKGIGSGNTPILRSEEHTSELQSLMRISYAVFCLKKKKKKEMQKQTNNRNIEKDTTHTTYRQEHYKH